MWLCSSHRIFCSAWRRLAPDRRTLAFRSQFLWQTTRDSHHLRSHIILATAGPYFAIAPLSSHCSRPDPHNTTQHTPTRPHSKWQLCSTPRRATSTPPPRRGRHHFRWGMPRRLVFHRLGRLLCDLEETTRLPRNFPIAVSETELRRQEQGRFSHPSNSRPGQDPATLKIPPVTTTMALSQTFISRRESGARTWPTARASCNDVMETFLEHSPIFKTCRTSTKLLFLLMGN